MTNLECLRGAAAPKSHNARTIAALTTNPGCSRRAVMDAAGIDKERLASHVGFPARFGQSQFAITRGNVFEAQLKANGCAELLRLLREVLALPIGAAAYDDLESVNQLDARADRSRELLTRAADGDEDAGTLFDHPLLRLEVGGRWVYLEPDLIALQFGGKFYVVEIKSFAVIDGKADGTKVSAAATQSAVYVLAMRRLLAEAGYDPGLVSHDVVLVCPENFSNRPVATLVDVRKKLSVLERQLARMGRIDAIVDGLSPSLTFDLQVDDAGVPQRPVAELVDGMGQIDARYSPECLANCELAFFCRHEARGSTAALGKSVREELGGVSSVSHALSLASGAVPPAEDEIEAAEMLRFAAKLRSECLS
ncbi:hypothetical protein HC028_21205 [Planosporangium flavigriseum]|uniref:Secreted protein n=1 Tax=Planosporangium flavigriseum TaxID=373681 RepID=A0A8J3LU84_9ACTN|nr:hypothetical protein [Planosporangium flavigriseum]NJC67002.1 hypothetical protein [Planosporangium flavigriseum]GIG73929.1 hypothetical protein Pfl04_23330 [Planosporangium flavigriseum]